MATDILVENNFLKKWKKTGLWDHGVATGVLGQKPDKKKWPGLSDSGMASGGLILFFVVGGWGWKIRFHAPSKIK